MRTFKLTNGKGTVFDLMRTDAFFHAPIGLGVSNELSVSRVGDSYFVTDSKDAQPKPSGEMVFAGYAQYDEFLAFCRVGGLVLGYKPLDTWLYLDCWVDISKGEISRENNCLVCSVTFTGVSNWYAKVVEYKANLDAGAGKVYPYTYLYEYSSSETGTVAVTGLTIPSYCKIHIFGPAVNPVWSLYQNGTLVSKGRCTITLDAGYKLVIDSNPVSMELAEYTIDNRFVSDEYQHSDFTTERFITLPAGASELRFTQDDLTVLNAYVEVNKRV